MEEQTIIRPATLDDIKYLDHLRNKEAEALSFIPKSAYERQVLGGRTGDIFLSWDNGDPTGFIYATHSKKGTTRILQVAIQEDARRMERATALVDAVRDAGFLYGSYLLSLRCADDLAANDFWPALGFSLAEEGLWPKARGTRKVAQNKRGRLINVYERLEPEGWLFR